VGAGLEEGAEPFGGKRNRVRRGNADEVETLRAGERGELGLERRQTQKSRLA
jgi:hypothetical protein